MILHVVMRSVGEYSDRNVEPVAVYENAVAAKTHVELENAKAREREAAALKNRRLSNEHPRSTNNVKIAALESGDDRYQDERYYVEETPFLARVPDELRGIGGP